MYDDTIETSDVGGNFRKLLEEATEVVNSWPSWKQSVLEKAIGVSESPSSGELDLKFANQRPDDDEK